VRGAVPPDKGSSFKELPLIGASQRALMAQAMPTDDTNRSNQRTSMDSGRLVLSWSAGVK